PISRPPPEAPKVERSMAQTPALVIVGTNSVFRIDGERVFGRPDFVAYVPGYKLMYISTRHFRVFKMGDEWFIEDLGSANGTFLNGVDIRGRGPQKLSDGDVISVAGEIKLVFRTS
ncbi:FHA domain-containing protein, partial [Pyrobaculum sp.]|uniref:FHA domain-containing protein n=1 Tax=Pyrobaculum sp. TaxID=2004705 RepID=UPI003D0B2A60